MRNSSAFWDYVQPGYYVQEVAAWIGVVLMGSLLGIAVRLESPPLAWAVGIVSVGGAGALIYMILSRGMMVRRWAKTVGPAEAGEPRFIYEGAQTVSGTRSYGTPLGPGMIGVSAEGIAFWPLNSRATSEPPALMVRRADVELVRRERGSRVLFYPVLEIVCRDTSRIRVVLIKQRGLSWRAGMTHREFGTAQQEIADALKLPGSQLTRTTGAQNPG